MNLKLEIAQGLKLFNYWDSPKRRPSNSASGVLLNIILKFGEI